MMKLKKYFKIILAMVSIGFISCDEEDFPPVLSEIFFKEHTIIDQTTSTETPYSVLTADIDNDGDMDVLSASHHDNKIAWYENTDGLGTFGTQHIITTKADSAVDVFAIDIDSDGDIDVLSASYGDDKIAWYENIDGLGAFGEQQIITTNAELAYSVFATDLDGDGDIDVLSASHADDKIAWYENTDGLGSFGIQQIITANADGARDVYATDIDGDGDMDVVSASATDDIIAWYENTDGLGTFGTQKIITTNANAVKSVYTSDINGDGDMDVLSASGADGKIAWYENIDGQGVFGTQHTIDVSIYSAEDVYAADIDDDGDMDVISALSLLVNGIAWYENMDGQGTFSTRQYISKNTDYARSVYASDIDGDGDIDVISASSSDDRIAWYKNTDGLGSFGKQQNISQTTNGARSVFATDIDNDGDMDILSASISDNRMAWYENMDGLGSFSKQQNINTNCIELPEFIYASDIDGDGDMDVITALLSDSIIWHENINGLGNFGVAQIISTNIDGADSVYSTDLDGDGDNDVLSSSIFDNKIAWYENTDGLGNFGSQQIISTNTIGAEYVYASDLDGDGDMDVLSASRDDNKIAWYENTNGQGSFGSQRIITTKTDGAKLVYAADLDNDGDMDVLSGSSKDDTVAWYENTNGQGGFGSQQIIGSNIVAVSSVYASDIDGDGDIDVLTTSYRDNRISWFENTNGLGAFGVEQIISSDIDSPTDVYATDIDGDGDIDVLSSSSGDDKIAWYENTGK